MPPRLRLRSLRQLADLQIQRNSYVCSRCQYATVSAITPAPSASQMTAPPPSSISRHSAIQPPSYRDPAYRKSQLLRSYVSLLQCTPLIILFQHNNIKSTEWVGIRRELANALRKVDEQLAAADTAAAPVGPAIKLQVVRTAMFEPALRITEYFDPAAQPPTPPPSLKAENLDPSLTHALSTSAYLAASQHKYEHPLTPLLAGPIAVLTFPTVSPAHLKAALSILTPNAPNFRAPTRRLSPGYWEPSVQDGLKKMLLLGARVGGRVFDADGARWVGGLDGGIDGLRAQLVAMLQGFGGGLAATLESAGRSVWFTMEGRRRMMEEEQTPKEAVGEEKKDA